MPIYFGGTAHDGAPHKLVPAGTACHLEHVPIRAYEVRDVWFLVTIDGGEQSGLQVWARSPYLHPVL